MHSTQTIRELQGRTSVTSLEALRALVATQGDLALATEYLNSPSRTARSLQVNGAERAATLASQLTANGLWFESERQPRDGWRFTVVPAAHAQLVSLHSALLGPRRA